MKKPPMSRDHPETTSVLLNNERSSKRHAISVPTAEVHQASLAAARYEGTLLWQIFSVFLIIHTAIVGFVVQGIDPRLHACKDVRILIASLVGIALSLLWGATYSRNSSHYRYFLNRARESEPQGWHLYGGKGQDFSNGNTVQSSAGSICLQPHARWVRSGRMIPPVICVFLLVYILGLVTSLSGCLKSKSTSILPSPSELLESTNNETSYH